MFYITISLKLDFDGKFGLSTSKYIILHHSGLFLKSKKNENKYDPAVNKVRVVSL